MEFLKRNWVILSLSVITLILLQYMFNYNEWGIKWKPEPLIEFSKIVIGLTVAASLLDQFIEVFFSEKKNPKEDRANAQAALKIGQFVYLERLSELANAESDFSVNTTSINSETKIEGLKTDINNYKNRLEGHETEINNLDNIRSGEIRKIAFVVGLVLSLSGVNVLTSLIDLKSNDYNYQLLVYSDIILTASLLSGGTAGISQFFTMITSQIKNNTK